MKHFLLVLISVVLFSCGSDKESDPTPKQKTITYTIENRSNTGTTLHIELFYTNKLNQSVEVQEMIDEKTLAKGVYTKTVNANTKYKEVILRITKSTTPQQDTVKYRVNFAVDGNPFYASYNTNYGLDIETAN